MNQNLQQIATTWGRQVLLNYLKSRTATAAAGGSLLVVALPRLMDYLSVAPGQTPTQTQIIVGALIGIYILARGLADHGKEAVLMDVRKNLSVALGNGSLSEAKTVAFQAFVESGDLAALMKVLKEEEEKAKAEEEAAATAGTGAGKN